MLVAIGTEPVLKCPKVFCHFTQMSSATNLDSKWKKKLSKYQKILYNIIMYILQHQKSLIKKWLGTRDMSEQFACEIIQFLEVELYTEGVDD